jgi:predicted acyltransferase
VLIPGRLHDGIHDPEGFLSTLPAISTALLGMLTGTFLHRSTFSMYKKAGMLVLAGIVLVVLGLLWDTVFPINKRLWSSSFVLYVGGLSLLFFAGFYFVIDVLEFKRWAFPFVLIGTNSIVIYLAAEGMVNFAYTRDFIFGGLIHLMPLIWQPVFAAVFLTLLQLGLLYFLYKNKLFLKV